MTIPNEPVQASEPDAGRDFQNRNTQPGNYARPLTLGLVALLVAAGLLAILLNVLASPGRPLYPALATTSPLETSEAGAPTFVTFEELNADPQAFIGRRLQASGAYTPKDRPDCAHFAGPLIRWTMVDEGLQLNATGFEAILNMVQPGTSMTVEGTWQLYQGPVGCGKAPPSGSVWFLAVDQIIEPNPLVNSTQPLLTVVAGETGTGSLVRQATPTLESDEGLIITATAELLPTETLSATQTPALSPTPSATATSPVTGTVPASATADPLASPTVTPSATPAPGSTATIPPINPTSDPQTTQTPAIPTSTIPSGPYPGATNTPSSSYP